MFFRPTAPDTAIRSVATSLANDEITINNTVAEHAHVLTSTATSTPDDVNLSHIVKKCIQKTNFERDTSQLMSAHIDEATAKPDLVEQTNDDRSYSPMRRGESGILITRHLPFGRVVNGDVNVTQNNLISTQSIFAPITNRICNYASLYNLLIVSDVISTQTVTSYPSIPKDQMMLDDVNQIDDHALFQVGFTRKDCSYTPITHASLAFRNLETGKFLVVGRQNPQFLKGNASMPDSSFAWWAFSTAVNPYTILRFPVTRMDNEMKYNFFPGTLFNAEITDAIMSGAEIKELIKVVDQKICVAQSYDVVHSNCYSAVSYGLAKVFEMTANKHDATLKDQEATEDLIKNNKALKRLFTLICHALKDNYKVGSGSINNTVVNDAIQKTIDILDERKLLKIIDKTLIPSLGTSLLEYESSYVHK